MKGTARALIPIAALALPAILAAQAPGSPAIRSGEDVRVSAGEGFPHIEPHLAVDPTGPDRLVVAAMVLTEPGAGLRIHVYRSEDGGDSWSAGPLVSEEDGRNAPGVDPWLAFDPEGVLHFAMLPGWVWRSDDAGASWHGPSDLPRRGAGTYDAPRMEIDRSDGPRRGHVYVVAMQPVQRDREGRITAVAVLSSADGGDSFDGPRHILPDDVGKRHGDIAVLADGSLLVTFHDLFHEGRVLESPRLWSACSLDGGETFSTPSLITDRFLALSPMLAVDRSGGPHGGRVYAAWLGLGGDRNRYVAHTDDAGATWSDPLRVTNVPDSTVHPTATMVAVAADGTVGLMWAEPLPELEGACFEYRFAASVDGGASFTEPAAVSDSAACADTAPHRVVMDREGPRQATVLQRFPQGGDYFGFVGLTDGSFRAVWPDARTGTFQLWTDRIEVDRRPEGGPTVSRPDHPVVGGGPTAGPSGVGGHVARAACAHPTERPQRAR